MSVTDTHKVSKVIILKSDRCLLLCREDGKGWELPGGHLNLRESYTDGAIRECLEETGVQLTLLRLIYKEKNYNLFKSKPRVTKIKLSDEHTDYTWVNHKQIHKLKLSNSTKRNLRRILDVISLD
jgi:8-oxo-dGTP diphosphatase